MSRRRRGSYPGNRPPHVDDGQYVRWHNPDVHDLCAWLHCRNDASDRYPVKLCQAHMLLVWSFVETDRAKRVPAELRAERDRLMYAAAARERIAANGTDELPGFIYYLEVGDLIKVGYTADLWSRLSHYPPQTVVLAHHRGLKADERRAHWQLSPHRAKGREWYHATSEVRAHIADVVATHGPPTVLGRDWTEPTVTTAVEIRQAPG